MGSTIEALEKIAAALERIAVALENAPMPAGEPMWAPPEPHPHSTSVSPSEPDTADPSPVAEEGQMVVVRTPAVDRRDVLRTWLGEREIIIQREKGPFPGQEALEPIAIFIGSQFERVKPVIDALKRGNADGAPQTVNLREQAPVVVTNSVNLAHRLHALALIEAFKYHRAPAFLLHLTPSRLPTAINFITGGWLELFVRTVLFKVLYAQRPEAAFSLLENPQVTLPTGEDFELDLLLEVEGEVWWVEMKTGAFQRHIAKYNRISRLLRLPPSRCFMVLCDASAEVCIKLSSLFAMSVISVSEAEAALTESLRPRV